MSIIGFLAFVAFYLWVGGDRFWEYMTKGAIVVLVSIVVVLIGAAIKGAGS